MTREQCIKMLPIITAFAEGKHINIGIVCKLLELFKEVCGKLPITLDLGLDVQITE